jgi:hypothetical protein
MEDYERNALRRLVKVSLRHHGIDKLKTEADKAKSRVMMVASWHRSRDHDEFAELSSEDGSEDGSSEEESYAVNTEVSMAEDYRLRVTDQRLGDAEQKMRLLEEQHRLELERLRQQSRQAQVRQTPAISEHTYMASARGQLQTPMPTGARIPHQQFGTWENYGPPQLSPGMFPLQRNAEEAYWDSGAGGGYPPQMMMPHMMSHMMPPMMPRPNFQQSKAPNFQQSKAPARTHGQVFPVGGPAAAEEFSNLDDASSGKDEN